MKGPERVEFEMVVAAPPERVWQALTDAGELERWFCERAGVDEGTYAFWGRYTMGAPAEDKGRHPILDWEPVRLLRFAWVISNRESTVEVELVPSDRGTTVRVLHDGLPRCRAWSIDPAREDGDYSGAHPRNFWAHALGSLRAWVEDGREVPRFDYTLNTTHEIRLHVDVEADVDTVWGTLVDTLGPSAPTDGDTVFQMERVPPVHLKLIDLDRPRRLSYTWEGVGIDTIITWTLEGSGGGTRLEFVQSGFGDSDNPQGMALGFFDAAMMTTKFRCEGRVWDWGRVLQATS